MTHIKKSFKKYSCSRQFGTHVPIPLSFPLITGWYSDYKNQYTKSNKEQKVYLNKCDGANHHGLYKHHGTPRGRRK